MSLHTLLERRRAAAARDEGVAMLTVIMLIMVMSALSVLMLGVMVAQVKPTMYAGKNTRTIFAAETGLDSALSQIRSAIGPVDMDGKYYGAPTLLPCSVQGKVDSSTSTLTYAVNVSYFDQDPTGKDDAWRSTNKLACVSGAGVTISPSFAILSATGLDAGVAGLATTAGDRLLETMYTFKVTHNNIEGGTIYAFGDKHCLQAAGQNVGDKVTYVDQSNCGGDDPRQLWTYGKDYEIHLSVTDLGATPLCLTGNSSTGGNVDVTLTKCVTGNTDQQFSWKGGAKWIGQLSTGKDYSTYCLTSGDTYDDTKLINKTLKYGDCLGDNTAYASFDPDPRVGAGAASYTTGQIVNSLEFGRCMDVTGEKVIETYMIDYPCKQDPSGGGKLKWNHKWKYTEPPGLVGTYTGQISVYYDSSDTKKGDPYKTYCLKTPSASASPAYVTFVTPCSSTAADQKWTRTADTGVYTDSWTFTDQYGRCISLSGDKLDSSWSKLIMATCSGGPEQKWNAPVVNKEAGLSDYKELKN
ncbi:ricin-type beta-trefoil lectin domain protein [Cellulomonas sp. URHE0023]|uniref:RICIN domain-containing protein n=1 Tax=Cellulomonas sp. URHE0023 TaxID=1380354 RepID=UPI0018CC31BF|nr:ricin-type beta-trefoil lectin domain protein [Cellulomonas sp. URHE0023]